MASCLFNSYYLFQAFSSFLFIQLFFSLLEATTTSNNNVGFTIDLIHRDSPESPLYKPSNSHFNILRNAILRSNSKFQSQIFPNGGQYLMKLSIGTPPIEVLGVADTGSDVSWTQCEPCTQCFKQQPQIFDPKQSLTYKALSCQSQPCQSLGMASKCNNTCEYSVQYADSSFTVGDLAVDTFTFGSTSGQPVSFSNVVFGCGHNNTGTLNDTGSGIIGLGTGPLSIINQLSPSIAGKFSYCLVPLDSDREITSKINFGSNAVVSGSGVVSTPLINTPGTSYYLTLNSISISNKNLPFKNSKIGSTIQKGNIIIDSGTTLTLIPRAFYEDFELALVEAIKRRRINDPGGVLNLCYSVENGGEIDIPTITAHFSGGADVELSPKSTFVKVQEGVMCCTIVPSNDLALFGNLSQRNLLVGFDLVKKEVSFKPTDCTKQSS